MHTYHVHARPAGAQWPECRLHTPRIHSSDREQAAPHVATRRNPQTQRGTKSTGWSSIKQAKLIRGLRGGVAEGCRQGAVGLRGCRQRGREPEGVQAGSVGLRGGRAGRARGWGHGTGEIHRAGRSRGLQLLPPRVLTWPGSHSGCSAWGVAG